MSGSHTVADPSFLCFGVGLITVQFSYAQERKAVTSGLKILTDCAGYCAPGTLATADICVNTLNITLSRQSSLNLMHNH